MKPAENNELKDSMPSGMSFHEACEILGVPDFCTRIFHSNSRGELMHLWFYFEIARDMKAHPEKDRTWFRPIFLHCVKFAEENWNRPESCFQWMDRLMRDCASETSKEP